jgi:hypothetical protein
MRTNPEKGAELATQLANDENGALVDIERVSHFSIFPLFFSFYLFF